MSPTWLTHASRLTSFLLPTGAPKRQRRKPPSLPSLQSLRSLTLKSHCGHQSGVHPARTGCGPRGRQSQDPGQGRKEPSSKIGDHSGGAWEIDGCFTWWCPGLGTTAWNVEAQGCVQGGHHIDQGHWQGRGSKATRCDEADEEGYRQGEESLQGW